MATEDISYTVKKAVKNVNLTDEAVLSGFGDPVGEATRQLRLSIQDKMDSDAVELLANITPSIGHVLTVETPLDYDTIIDAYDLMPVENQEQGIAAFLLVNHTTAKGLRKNPRFIDRQTQLGDTVLTTGVVGAIAGCNVVISNKLTDTRSYVLTPQVFTAFMKRDVAVEQQREMLYKRTIIGSDCHFIIAIEDYDKLVAIEHAVAGVE